ncbi:Sporulation kinase E [compost metagenome]
MITVTIGSSGNDLMITIRDNGSGMDQAMVQELTESWTATQGGAKGIGLYNVQRRIQLHFGEGYGIKAESRLGEGTVFYILLPGIPG